MIRLYFKTIKYMVVVLSKQVWLNAVALESLCSVLCLTADQRAKSVHLPFLHTPLSHAQKQCRQEKRQAGEAAVIKHFSRWPVKGRQSWHMQGPWPLLRDWAAGPLGSSIRPTRWHAGRSANGHEWRTCLRPAHTSFSSSAAPGIMYCDGQINIWEYIMINNNQRKPGQPAMKVTCYAIHSDSIQLRRAWGSTLPL